MSMLLMAGIGALVAGLVAVAFGIPVKEFSFGNTLILSGAVIGCTGLIMVSLSLVVREMRAIAQRLHPGAAVADRNTGPRLSIPEPSDGMAQEYPPLSNADQTGRSLSADTIVASSVSSPPPRQAEMSTRDRTGAVPGVAGSEPSVVSDTPTTAKPRRNLLFSSSSRKERERAMARSPSDPATTDMPLSVPVKAPVAGVSPPPSFDEAWPQSDRSRLEPGRSAAVSPAASARTDRAPSDSRGQNASAVTVLKSGVVDGMAYSLYSDGSIEAQMPEGMMRFASIDELRKHLDQKP
ncbi:MAG: hypothetical protein JSS22_13155 [Proteobacteria bacterium]|nr:hypothetical protein [Pseudomonadota bacterium]